MRTFLTSTITASLLAAAPAPVLGQRAESRGGSVLMLLEAEGRIEIGGEVQSALSSADYLSPDDSYLDAWSITAQAGQEATIDLTSDQFDTYLYVVGPGFGVTLTDDDGGPGCNSRLTLTFLEDGEFRIVASALGSRETGVYTLRVTSTPEPFEDYDCGGLDPAMIRALSTDNRRLVVGQEASGELTLADRTLADRHVQAWALQGVAGEDVTVDLTSEDFDAYLYITGPGLDGTLTDDDGGPGCDSRITFAFPEDGEYRVVATALGSRETGRYTVRATAIPEPFEDYSCGGMNTARLRALPTEGRTIELGQTATGELSLVDETLQGRHVQAWAFEADAGSRITITLESDDFDAYLYLFGPGMQSPEEDDDSAGNLNARLTTYLRQGGTYLIIASALSRGDTGWFQLSVVEGEPEMDEMR